MVVGTRKLVRIHRDVLEASGVEKIAHACDDLARAIGTKNVGAVISLREKLEEELGKSLPRQDHPALRENVEVLLVAVIAAMAIRTFFFQPFKIPTGSMQPTLYGVYPSRPPESQYQPPIAYAEDAAPARRGPVSEALQQLGHLREYEPIARPSILERLPGAILFGAIYEEDGYRLRGDHVFVDRFTYHFRKPRRGEVVVFATDNIPELLGMSSHGRGTFYIKRLIGLEHDTIQIKPPHVLVNGKVMDDRPAFERIYSLKNGYQGYTTPMYAKHIHRENDIYTVPAKSLFVLGDNSPNSLDGRFWGSFQEKDLVGRAIVVYWPITKRFGQID